MNTILHKNILIFCTNITKKLEIHILLHSQTVFHHKTIYHTAYDLIKKNKIQTPLLVQQFQIYVHNNNDNNTALLQHKKTDRDSSFTSHNTQTCIHALIQLNKTTDTLLLQTMKKRDIQTHTIKNSVKEHNRGNMPILFHNNEDTHLVEFIRILKATIDGYITNNTHTITQCSGILHQKLLEIQLPHNSLIYHFYLLLLQMLQSL